MLICISSNPSLKTDTAEADTREKLKFIDNYILKAFHAAVFTVQLLFLWISRRGNVIMKQLTKIVAFHCYALAFHVNEILGYTKP